MTLKITLLSLCTFMCALSAASGDILDDLLPVPHEVAVQTGIFPVDFSGMRFSLTTTSEEEAARLHSRLKESLARVALEATVEVSQGDAFTLSLAAAETAASIPPASAPLPEKARAEGYQLTIAPDGVLLRAESEKGLFYGMMTLEQLLLSAKARNAAALPCAVLLDWPALPMRGFSEDYGRDQLPTMEEHKRSIRDLARFKANTYLWFIEPDHFVYAFDPEISAEYDRFTFGEIRELVAYAKEYYMDIIPTVELLGHMEQTLRHERYRHLAEMPSGGGDLCATSEEAFDLVRKMVGEIAPAFDGEYFHCGLDESYAIGKGRSAAVVEALGIERVFADYYTKMNGLVKSHDRTMMMYADIVLNHPDMIDLLPKDIVMMFWDYMPRDEYPGLTTLRDKGLPVTALSGLWSWNNLYPVYPPAFRNMETLAAQAEKDGALGHFVSSWGDPYKGAAGINLNEWDHYGVAYCAAVSWNTNPVPMDRFSGAYAAQFFGSADPALGGALTRLARCQGDDLGRVCQARYMLHCEPEQAVWSIAGADAQTLAYWENLQEDTRRVHEALGPMTPSLNPDYLATVDLAARLLNCAAGMALAFHQVAAAMEQPDFDREEAAAGLLALAERHRALWGDYQRVWRATNRPLNLERIGGVWTGTTDGLVKLADAIRAGEFPTAPRAKELLAVFDFDSDGDAAWKDNQGNFMLAPAPDAPAPEIVPGGPAGKGGHLRLAHGSRCEVRDTLRLLDLRMSPLLVEAWVRHTGQREQQYGATIVSYGLGGGWRLGLNHKGELLFTLYGIGEQAGANSIVPPDGQWHHVAVNFSDCRLVTCFIDGARTEELELQGYPHSPADPLIRIGNEIALVTPFAGDIDRIRISTGKFGPEELDK